MSFAIEERFSSLIYQKRPKSVNILLQEQLQSTKKWKKFFHFLKFFLTFIKFSNMTIDKLSAS